MIAVDLDDVLVDFWAEMLKCYNARNGTAWRKEQFHTYHAWEIFGGAKDHTIEEIEAFYQTPEFMELPMVEGAREALASLARAHELVVVTGRPEYTAEQTHALIRKHFPGFFVDVHFTNAYAQGDVRRVSKADVCKTIGATVLIEDHDGHAVPCAEQGTRVFLFDQPWNQKAPQHKNMTRVFSWAEIADAIPE